MGCGCGTNAVKETPSKQIVKTGNRTRTVTNSKGEKIKKPIVRRVIKRPAR